MSMIWSSRYHIVFIVFKWKEKGYKTSNTWSKQSRSKVCALSTYAWHTKIHISTTSSSQRNTFFFCFLGRILRWDASEILLISFVFFVLCFGSYTFYLARRVGSCPLMSPIPSCVCPLYRQRKKSTTNVLHFHEFICNCGKVRSFNRNWRMAGCSLNIVMPPTATLVLSKQWNDLLRLLLTQVNLFLIPDSCQTHVIPVHASLKHAWHWGTPDNVPFAFNALGLPFVIESVA